MYLRYSLVGKAGLNCVFPFCSREILEKVNALPWCFLRVLILPNPTFWWTSWEFSMSPEFFCSSFKAAPLCSSAGTGCEVNVGQIWADSLAVCSCAYIVYSLPSPTSWFLTRVQSQADVLKRGSFVGKMNMLVVPCTDKRLVLPLAL